MENYFSTNLKHLRIKRGLSQNKLASMMGVNQTTIARWEDDNRTPSIDNAIDVSNVLNVSLQELLGIDLRLVKETPSKTIDLGTGIVASVNEDVELTPEEAMEAINKFNNFVMKEMKKQEKK